MINDYAKKRAREYMQRTRDYDGPFKKKIHEKTALFIYEATCQLPRTI